MNLTPLQVVVAALEQRGGRVRLAGDQADALCPAHDDQSPSLSVRYDRAAGKVLLNCHAGCPQDEVVAALGLTFADLFDPKPEQDRARRPEVIATYPYTDEAGVVLFEKVRMFPKDFRVRRPDGRGGTEWRIGDARRVLYRLDEVRTAIAAGRAVLVVEGEKDADAVAEQLGMAATCNYEGAATPGQRAKWRPEYSEQLRGAMVLVVADNDAAGFAHARAVVASLQGIAAGAAAFRVAVDEPKADMSDHLAAGYGMDDLVPLDPAANPAAPEIAAQNPQNPGGREGSEGFEGAFPEHWPAPVPLPGRTDPIPTDALGEMLGPLVDAVGQALQVPTDLPVNLALPIITTAAGGGWIVEVQTGWTEALCLDTLSALPSGERKSPTLRVLDAPLRRFEEEAQKEARPERARKAAERQLAEDRVAEARKAAVKAAPGTEQERRYIASVEHLDTIEVPTLPRLLADDATPEAVVALLAEHRSIGIVSAEPGLFGVLAGRYSNGAVNIEWFLAATSGEPIKTDRVSRDAQTVTDPALSMAACIQPGRLVELGKVKAFRDSGLLARLLFALPTSDVGNRGPTRAVPDKHLDAWNRHLCALAAAGRKRRAAPATLLVDDDSRRALEELRAAIEPHLHPEHGRYAGIADWMNKLPGQVVRIAAAITLLHDPDAQEIPGATMRGAIRVGRAYVSHAIAAFGLTRPNGETFSHARQILATVRRLCLDAGTDSVSRRDVHQKLRDRSWVETVESLDNPVELLVEYGHLRHALIKHEAGGRPSKHLKLHPVHLAEQETTA